MAIIWADGFDIYEVDENGERRPVRADFAGVELRMLALMEPSGKTSRIVELLRARPGDVIVLDSLGPLTGDELRSVLPEPVDLRAFEPRKKSSVAARHPGAPDNSHARSPRRRR